MELLLCITRKRHAWQLGQALITGLALAFSSSPGKAGAQQPLPIIDMHMHALGASLLGPPPEGLCVPAVEFPSWDPQRPYDEVFLHSLKNPPCPDPVWSPRTDEELILRTVEVMKRRNVIGVLGGRPGAFSTDWLRAAPTRFIPSLQFDPAVDLALTADSARILLQKKAFRVIGELVSQYSGLSPGDEILEPYWALAEELDIPVGIHIGPGVPGQMYLGTPAYRAALHSALTLEPVLARHPRLRVYIMHAGWPMLDDLLAVLYAHPQVYAEFGAILMSAPRAEFDRYLKGIVDAGLSNRVMFGTDFNVWPAIIDRTIAAIESATYLSEKQKRDILYNNAARFLRLSDDEIARHHGR